MPLVRRLLRFGGGGGGGGGDDDEAFERAEASPTSSPTSRRRLLQSGNANWDVSDWHGYEILREGVTEQYAREPSYVQHRTVQNANRLVGGILLHQVRNEFEKCDTKRFEKLAGRCRSEMPSVKPFGVDPIFRRPPVGSEDPKNLFNAALESEINAYYDTSDPQKNVTMMDVAQPTPYGFIQRDIPGYPKGFPVYFDIAASRDHVANVIQYIKEGLYFDPLTRAVTAQAVTYNANLKQMANTLLTFEFMEAGFIEVTSKITNMNVKWYTDKSDDNDDDIDDGYVQGVMEGLLVAMIVYGALREMLDFAQNCVKEGGLLSGIRVHFSQFWNVMDFINIALQILAVLLWFNYQVKRRKELSPSLRYNVYDNPTSPIANYFMPYKGPSSAKPIDPNYVLNPIAAGANATNTMHRWELPMDDSGMQKLGEQMQVAQELSNLSTTYFCVTGVSFLFMIARALKFVKFQRHLDLTVRTLSRASLDLAHFLVVMFISLTCMMMIGHVIVGARVEYLSTLSEAFNFHFEMLSVGEGVEKLGALFVDENEVRTWVDNLSISLYAFFIPTYLLFVLLNILLGILCDAFGEEKELIEGSDEPTMYDDFSALVSYKYGLFRKQHPKYTKMIEILRVMRESKTSAAAKTLSDGMKQAGGGGLLARLKQAGLAEQSEKSLARGATADDKKTTMLDYRAAAQSMKMRHENLEQKIGEHAQQGKQTLAARLAARKNPRGPEAAALAARPPPESSSSAAFAAAAASSSDDDSDGFLPGSPSAAPTTDRVAPSLTRSRGSMIARRDAQTRQIEDDAEASRLRLNARRRGGMSKKQNFFDSAGAVMESVSPIPDRVVPSTSTSIRSRSGAREGTTTTTTPTRAPSQSARRATYDYQEASRRDVMEQIEAQIDTMAEGSRDRLMRRLSSRGGNKVSPMRGAGPGPVMESRERAPGSGAGPVTEDVSGADDDFVPVKSRAMRKLAVAARLAAKKKRGKGGDDVDVERGEAKSFDENGVDVASLTKTDPMTQADLAAEGGGAALLVDLFKVAEDVDTDSDSEIDESEKARRDASKLVKPTGRSAWSAVSKYAALQRRATVDASDDWKDLMDDSWREFMHEIKRKEAMKREARMFRLNGTLYTEVEIEKFLANAERGVRASGYFGYEPPPPSEIDAILRSIKSGKIQQHWTLTYDSDDESEDEDEVVNACKDIQKILVDKLERYVQRELESQERTIRWQADVEEAMRVIEEELVTTHQVMSAMAKKRRSGAETDAVMDGVARERLWATLEAKRALRGALQGAPGISLDEDDDGGGGGGADALSPSAANFDFDTSSYEERDGGLKQRFFKKDEDGGEGGEDVGGEKKVAMMRRHRAAKQMVKARKLGMSAY